MKIDIVVVYSQRYAKGHEKVFVPPLTGIHLAAITPAPHDVRVIHQKVQSVPFDSDADVVALSFFSGFAPEAYRLAREFRSRGKLVVAGGPHATFCTDEAGQHVDAVVVGEAEASWPELLADAERGRLHPVYAGPPPSLTGIPTPRYDLLPRSFFVPRVVQATRGCPFSCSFCSVPALNPGFRHRPVADVIRDIAYDRFPHWWQRRIVWFWDDNLLANRAYAKELLTAMIPYRRWWLTQASTDIAEDRELLDLMQRSGCIGVFLGIESFNPESLDDAGKAQNRVDAYQGSVEALHSRGICVMAGLVSGLDHDTCETIRDAADHLERTGVDVPFLSILTPFKGTRLYEQMQREGRLLARRGWEFYNGYNVTFTPARMGPGQLLESHRLLWRRAFAVRAASRRVLRASARLRLGAGLMSACMNGFYGLKALRDNLPADVGRDGDGSRRPPARPQSGAA